MHLFHGITLFVIFFESVKSLPCILKEFSDGYACVCNETYCDTYEDLVLPGEEYYLIASTSKGGLRLDAQKGEISINQNTTIIVNDKIPNNNENITSGEIVEANIYVTSGLTYQTIIGFGGAFTGAVSYILKNLPKSMQHFLYKSYYSNTEGINFNLMRMTIGGCDFDFYPWTYAETPVNDTSLSNFTSLNEEDMTKIHQVGELENVTNNYEIKKIAAAWSSPRWMKSNNEWSGKNHLLKEYYQVWAEYYLRWLTLMDEQNFTFWGLSTGNEPLNGIIHWNTIFFLDLGWTAQNQGKWVAEHLGPLIRSSKFQNIKIIGYDDMRTSLLIWLPQMDVGNENASNFIDGVGVHWYYDMLAPASYNALFHSKYPEKFLLNTEACIVHEVNIGSWSNAVLYMLDMYEDLTTYVQGWMIWNICLDENGGPKYLKHKDGSSIIVNMTANAEFYKNPSFYAIGQYSKFFLPDSVRVDVVSTNEKIRSLGFRRPDNSTAILIINTVDKPAIINLFSGNLTFNINLPASSIHTIVYFEN